MKKSLLLLVAGAISLSAGAQYANHSSILLSPNAYISKRVTPPSNRANTPAHHSAARTTSITTCTYTETFPSTVFTTGGSGGATDIWTAGTNSGTAPFVGSPNPGTWKWMSVGSGSGHSVGALASTTAANGWMIFDADSLQSLPGDAKDLPGGWLQSPAINCSALTTVGLSFQELFEEGVDDTCIVEVCQTPGFTTGVSYFPVYKNNNLFTESLTANADTVMLDITSAAAGHTVYIRFVYQDIGEGSSVWNFSWLIDDVCVGALATHDVGLDLTYIDQPFGGATTGAFSSAMFGEYFGETPLEFISTDSIYPVSTLTNYAHTAETNVAVTATISGTGAPAYSQTYTYASLPISAYDSGFVFPGYVPTSVGTYTVTFNAALTGDADPGNNTKVAVFNIDDSIWNVNNGGVDLGSAFYLYGTTTSTGLSTPLINCTGARFDLGPVAAGDTVSGFGVGFAYFSSSTGTGTVSVQLYSNTQGSSSWTYVASSFPRTVAVSAMSTSSDLRWTDFRTYNGFGPYGGVHPILQPNTTYAAIVQMNGVTSDLLIYSTDAPDATYFNGPGYFGQSGTSGNTGGEDFGSSDMTGTTYVPTVQMYFANIPHQNYNVGVQNVTLENFVGQPFPNPSNASFTIPITMAQDNNVTVTLTDVMGQVVNKQNINATGGQTVPVVFNTSNLAEGMYLYSIEADGQRSTGRVVVAH